ncbi:polysaccharide pyruvyl transferase family protein [Bacteroides cellulosilyticus]|nr:polysaccharide pyruvyl transferase family protein [Bacteroides cellulosilyticus]
MHFINPYKEIYTTRLHVAILSILTHKPFMFIDNSYGKNSSFYNTWLTDLNGSTFVRE